MIRMTAGKERFSDYPDYVGALAAVRAVAAEANGELGFLPFAKARAVVTASERMAKEGLTSGADGGWLGAAGRPVLDAVTGDLQRRTAQAGVDVTLEELSLNQAVYDVCATAAEIVVHDCLAQAELAARLTAKAFEAKAASFAEVVKCGRLGLQDAEPVRLGEEFSANAAQMNEAADDIASERIKWNVSHLGVGNLGTGIGIHPEFSRHCVKFLQKRTGRPFQENHLPMGGLMMSVRYLRAHGALEALAFAVWKAAHDFEFQASGPRGGVRELVLPAVAPGSSIMPGKINPTVAELAMAICNQVLSSRDSLLQGLHRSWTGPGPSSVLPIRAIMNSAQLLSRACSIFREKVVQGIRSEQARTERAAEQSLAVGLALVPRLGKTRTDQILKQAFSEGITVREAVVGHGLLTEQEAQSILDLHAISARH